MSPAIDFASTAKPTLDDLRRVKPSAEVRTATDIMSPLELFVECCPAGNVRSATAVLRTPVLDRFSNLRSPAADAWLLDAMSTVANFRGVKDGWDGADAIAPTKASLDKAEMLAALLAPLPGDLRPELSMDALGRPTFAANSSGLYLHLTVDEDGSLTWYAVQANAELFEDAVAFDGRRLPAALAELFTADA